MDLRQMEYLVALSEERHFTRAAALAGVSQSGLSAAIRSLESELGTSLFTRTTRHVEPTEAGRALLPHARAMLEQATAARDAVVQASRELSGTLRIGAEQCLGVVDVGALLERFRRRFPQVAIEFTQDGSHTLVSLVRSNDLDVALVATKDHLGGLITTELGREPLVAFLPPEHPLAERSRLGLRDLASETFIDFHDSWALRPLNDAAFAAAGVHRHVGMSVNDVHTLLELVDRGLGIAVAPRHVSWKPQATRLVTVPLPDQGAPEWLVSAVAAPWDRSGSPAPYLLELLADPPTCGGAGPTRLDLDAATARS
ncbi:LysR family transcriptional regulator [Actinotalea sp. M2MS4P-6]|uniref:LysR family transcriptional regulator n=1 Tax=Actinotalea sp. M2MS4P-6 TaxID=2983762 RepID=UPI0021E3B983|nr:LysR family transcriptional regulator [Actinotalea sp. M2MS4P-6]MCV2395666.1 LysR family transcriptional regulator [Actinotalea sp. M2MS4P-6]